MKKYHILTFGCQMNYADSERIASILENLKYKKTSNISEANLVVMTMCSIRQSAVDRIHWLSEKFKKSKAKPITILTGCILEKDRKVFVEGFDFVIDIKNISQIPKLLNKKSLSHKIDDRPNLTTVDYLDITPKNFSEFSANVPIMTGCNNFCAYCVVPYTRGREVSRSAKEIINEIKKLVNPASSKLYGVKEIWLLGQNVNSYRHCEELASDKAISTAGIATPRQGSARNDGAINFAKLLKEINKIKGDFWVRYTSSHPKDFKEDVINAMANLPDKSKINHITPYLNLPVQSGDDKVLQSMKRWYTIKQYKKIITNLRKKIPNIAISTDIIVGFPGETKKQFNNTVKLFYDIKFDMAYINKYSPRAGTTAAKLNDNVSWVEKKRREKVLTETLKKVAFENNKKLVGKTVRALIDHKKDNISFGKTDTYKSILIRNSSLKIGNFYDVIITKANNWNLEGKLI